MPNSSPRDFGRGQRRRANHHRAINEAAPVTELPEHPLIPTAAPQWIDTQPDLDDLIAHVRQMGSFAYDTEFIGEATYWPKLCLIQIGTTQRIAVIDAMAELDITGIWELLADEAVHVLVHAGAQDLEPVVRWLDRAPTNVFDVQIAAGFAGLPYPLSLLRLSAQLLGAKLGKRLTFTSWDHRPLPAAHLEYAADDVRLLHAIHQSLTERLAAGGRLDWVTQECAALCEPTRYKFDPAVSAAKFRGAKALTEAQMTALVEFVTLRDEAARHHDVPPRSMMKDEVLLDMVRRPVNNESKLDNIRGLPRPICQGYGQRILAIMATLLKAPRRGGGEEPEESAEQQYQVDCLWSALQSHCLAQGVYPALVTARPDVAEYVVARLDGLEPTGKFTTGWRRQLVGEFLDGMLAESAKLNLRWVDGVLRYE